MTREEAVRILLETAGFTGERLDAGIAVMSRYILEREQEAEARGRRAGIEEAADTLQERKHIAQRRASEAEADGIPFLPRTTDALKRVAMAWWSAEVIIRALTKHGEKP